jgi:hypothetical protein
VAAVLILAACGGTPQNANEPKANFTVEVPTATFPPAQILTQQTHLVIMVRNPGPKTIPNPSVTICNVTCGPPTGKWHAPPVGEGTTVAPFAVQNKTPGVANLSKQVWIVDQYPNPTPCRNAAAQNKSYNCVSGGPGGDAVGDNSNTWALGHPLKPGGTARFDWEVTAVCTGRYTVAWVVSAGVFGNAKAVLSDGSVPQGTFTVTINGQPQQSYVSNSRQIVNTGGPVPAPNGQNPVSPTPVPCTA